MESFKDMKRWVDEIKIKGPKDIILAIVGNKIDLCDKEEVEYASAKEYASSLGAILKLASAKDNKGIEVLLFLIKELFNAVGQTALNKMAKQSLS